MENQKNQNICSIIDLIVKAHNKSGVIERQKRVKHIYKKARVFLSKVYKRNRKLFVLLNFLYLLSLIFKNLKGKTINNKYNYIFFIKTNNQYTALKPYYDLMKNEKKLFYFYNRIKSYKLYIKDMIKIMKNYLFCKKHLNNKYFYINELYAFDIYLVPYYYYVLKKILQNLNVKKIFIASEQDIETMILKELVKELNIDIYYVQHAHIGNGKMSLPLDYNVSFLDSQSVCDIYKKVDNNFDERNIVLVGILKYLGNTNKIKIINKDDIRNIGISIGSTFSKNDLYSYIKDLIKDIDVNKTYHLIIKQHPGKDIEEYIFKDNEFNSNITIEYFDSQKKDIYKYIKKIDINISPVSSVHLDIVNLGKISLWKPYKEKKDLYTFFQKGLIKKIDDIDDIDEEILKYYTSFEYMSIIKYFNYSYLKDPKNIEGKILNAIYNN